MESSKPSSLKPCLCGGKAEVVYFTSTSSYLPWFIVKCINCGRKTSLYGKEYKAVEEWNAKAVE